MSSLYSHLLKEKIPWKRPLSSILHNIQFACGGLLLSEKISKKYKTIWIIQHVFGPVTVISSNIAYLVTNPKPSLFTIAYITLSTGTMVSCLVDELGCIFHHQKISNLIALIDSKFTEHKLEENQSNGNEIITFARWIKIISSTFCLAGVELFPPVLGLVNSFITLCYGSSRMHDIKAYYYSFPNLPRVNDVITYIGVIFWQMLSFCPAAVLCSFTSLNALIMTLEIRKEFAILKEDIELHSEEFQRRMSAIYESEGKLTKNPRNQITMRRRACCEEFFAGLDEFIQRHRQLIQSVDLSKPFVEFILTRIVLVLTVPAISVGFLTLSMPIDELEISFQVLVVFGALFCVIMLACFIGDTFIDMNKDIESAIYCMPWYELTPTQRKVAHLFLCQAQRTIEIKAYKTYSVSFELAPTFLNFVYSQIVGLKTIHDKNK